MEAWIVRIVRAIHPLDRQAKRAEAVVTGDMDGFEMPQQRGAAVPRRMLRQFDNIVAIERAERDELHVLENVEPREEGLEFITDFQETIFAPIHKVHFVDGDDE